MPVEPGSKLGHYEIVALIGAGGMGVVYRAHDPKLKRDVAVKVLPGDFAADADRMARFEREARVLASLNHPHIASIYGLEQNALVLELVEGPTLAERIEAGPLPLDEALAIAKQIAEALEYAHEAGIVHRDLKPANVKLTDDGDVKVLDFGLAKALGDEETAALDSSLSPTLTRAGTQTGVLLGTAGYMSPEQAKGKRVDRRADIWAFGVVLFEMLTGEKLFSGETPSETLAAVIKDAIDWSRLPPGTPAHLQKLLRRCLTRDPKERLQAIGEARIGLAHPEEEERVVPLAPTSSAWRRALPWALAGLLALVSTALVLRSPPPKRVTRLHADIGAQALLYVDHGPAAVLSPDGSMLAFAATSDGERRLFVRRLEDIDAAPLPGTEGARNAFFSPDGRWIGFFAGGTLKKIAVAGGAAVTLADAPDDRGGSWSEDGTIVFAPGNRTPLSRVSASGGAPEPLTRLDEDAREVTHRWPQVLPGGRAILYTASGNGNNYADANIVAYLPERGAPRIVHRGGFYARYIESGHLLFIHDRTLFATAFDLDRLSVVGSPFPVPASLVSREFRGTGQFAVSTTGTLVYVRGTDVSGQGSRLEWRNRDGGSAPIRDVRMVAFGLAFSPDGRKIAFSGGSSSDLDVWIYDLEQDTLSRLTFEDDNHWMPVWTPDGQRIAFKSDRGGGGQEELDWTRADGTGGTERLTERAPYLTPSSWHPSGKLLALERGASSGDGLDILVLPVEGDEGSGFRPGEPKPFLESAFNEIQPAFSPDGRWLAYASNETGTSQIYVRPFPGPGGKWQISTDGGVFPMWATDANELLYYDTSGSHLVLVTTYRAQGDTFLFAKPKAWSEHEFVADMRGSFALHPDGERFVGATSPENDDAAPRDELTFVFNFFDELERLAPVE